MTHSGHLKDTPKIAIVTVSDRSYKGEREDLSAQVIKTLLEKTVPPIGDVIAYSVLPDEESLISKELIRLADETEVHLIITTGGTGFGPRDVTPEATLDVIHRQVPGLAEAMRIEGLKHTPKSMLSRAVSGIRNRTLIINLPGSPKAVRENLEVVLPSLRHGIDILRGTAEDCGSLPNFP